MFKINERQTWKSSKKLQTLPKQIKGKKAQRESLAERWVKRDYPECVQREKTMKNSKERERVWRIVWSRTVGLKSHRERREKEADSTWRCGWEFPRTEDKKTPVHRFRMIGDFKAGWKKKSSHARIKWNNYISEIRRKSWKLTEQKR